MLSATGNTESPTEMPPDWKGHEMHDRGKRIIGTVQLISAGIMFAALVTGSEMILVIGMCVASFAIGMSVMRPK